MGRHNTHAKRSVELVRGPDTSSAMARKEDRPESWVLDGYPRNLSQAEDFLVHGVCPSVLVTVRSEEHQDTQGRYKNWLNAHGWETDVIYLDKLRQWAKSSGVPVVKVSTNSTVSLSDKSHPDRQQLLRKTIDVSPLRVVVIGHPSRHQVIDLLLQHSTQFDHLDEVALKQSIALDTGFKQEQIDDGLILQAINKKLSQHSTSTESVRHAGSNWIIDGTPTCVVLAEKLHNAGVHPTHLLIASVAESTFVSSWKKSPGVAFVQYTTEEQVKKQYEVFNMQMRLLKKWCMLWGVAIVTADMNETVNQGLSMNKNNVSTLNLTPLLEIDMLRILVAGLPGCGTGKVVNWIQANYMDIEYMNPSLMNDASLKGWTMKSSHSNNHILVKAIARRLTDLVIEDSLELSHTPLESTSEGVYTDDDFEDDAEEDEDTTQYPTLTTIHRPGSACRPVTAARPTARPTTAMRGRSHEVPHDGCTGVEAHRETWQPKLETIPSLPLECIRDSDQGLCSPATSVTAPVLSPELKFSSVQSDSTTERKSPESILCTLTEQGKLPVGSPARCKLQGLCTPVFSTVVSNPLQQAQKRWLYEHDLLDKPQIIPEQSNKIQPKQRPQTARAAHTKTSKKRPAVTTPCPQPPTAPASNPRPWRITPRRRAKSSRGGLVDDRAVVAAAEVVNICSQHGELTLRGLQMTLKPAHSQFWEWFQQQSNHAAESELSLSRLQLEATKYYTRVYPSFSTKSLRTPRPPTARSVVETPRTENAKEKVERQERNRHRRVIKSSGWVTDGVAHSFGNGFSAAKRHDIIKAENEIKRLLSFYHNVATPRANSNLSRTWIS